jgi:hypothetical protein
MASPAAAPPISRLPEELLLQILTYLETPPPSLTNARQEPSLKLTVTPHKPYKQSSCVSKLWRRVTLPLLFKHVRFRLDDCPKKHWEDCPFCNETSLNETPHHGAPEVHDFHADMRADALRLLGQGKCDETQLLPAWQQRMPYGQSMVRNYLTWVPRFYHGLQDILDFLEARNIASCVESFVVMTDRMLSEKLDRFPHRAAPDRDWRYKAAAAMWQHLFSTLNPSRVVILAPPMDLACLTNCAIDTFGDWAFGDMDFHLLDLSLVPSSHPTASSQRTSPPFYESLDYMPTRFPGLSSSSILLLRPWDSISINEGAFLKAYGTYEYFERGPPSLIYSIKDSLSPRPIFDANAQRISPTPLASLRKLTYTAIFPFSNHLDFRDLLPQLEELDLQLAPSLDSNILSQPGRVGKAELEDCWAELVSVYSNLASQLATYRISERNLPRLKKFVCRDSKIPALQEELDEVFVHLCLPVWVEYQVGEFGRVKMDAELPEGMGFDW